MNFKEKKMSNYLGLFSGGKFHLQDMIPEEIKIKDITHALSMICRFGGHSRYFYSVAQHSLNVMKMMKDDGYTTDIILYGLLHDASEAYLGDIPRPLKQMLPEYEIIEEKLQKVIWEHFKKQYGLPIPGSTQLSLVKTYDDYALSMEAKALFSNSTKWELPPYPKRLNGIYFELKSHHQVEREFNRVVSNALRELKDQNNKAI